MRIIEALLKESPDNLEILIELIQSRTVHASLEKLDRQFEIHIQCLRELESVPDKLKSDARWRFQLAAAYISIANTAWSKGDLECADNYSRLALKENTTLINLDPENDEYKWQRLRSLNAAIRSRFGWRRPLVTTGKLRSEVSEEETSAYFDESLQLAEERLAEAPQSWAAALDLINTTHFAATLFKPPEEAERLLLRCLDIAKSKLESRPDVPDLQSLVTANYHRLEIHYERHGEYEKAIEMLRHLLDHRKKHSDNPKLVGVDIYADIGRHFRSMGRLPDTIEAFQSSLNVGRARLEVESNEDERKYSEFIVHNRHIDVGKTKMHLGARLVDEGETMRGSQLVAEGYADCCEGRRLTAEFTKTYQDGSGLPLAKGVTFANLNSVSSRMVAHPCEVASRIFYKDEIFLRSDNLHQASPFHLRRTCKRWDRSK